MSSVIGSEALGRPGSTAGASLVLPLALLSGAAGLAWQMLWTAQLTTALGHDIVAVLAVVAAFFGGIALGAQTLGKVVARSRWPGRWYAGCELAMAVWGMALSLALPHLVAPAARLVGAEPPEWWHWTLAFGLPLLLMLPATVAMGATLPAMERQWRSGHSRLGALYAVNTFGAVGGVLLTVFVLVPELGLQRTGWLCAAVNLVCAALAWALWRSSPVRVAADRTHLASWDAAPRRLWPVAAQLLLTGLLGIGYEVLAVRVLSQVTENTVYSYALLLAIYLIGTACGAALYERHLARRRADGSALQARLVAALLVTLLLGGASLWWAEALCALPARWWGNGAVTALAGEALAGAVALLAPSCVMGALFTHLCLRAGSEGWPLGSSLALNTAGAALAPVVVGVGLLPAVGAAAGLAALVMGYALLQHPAHWYRRAAWLPVVAGLALLLWAPPLRFIDLPPGSRLVSYQEGVMAAVSVVEDAEGVSRLRINNRAQEGSSASGQVELRLAQLPLLLHPAPSRVLVLGLGTGFTARAAARDARQVDVVELVPEVIEAAAGFAPPAAAQTGGTVHLMAGDARRHVQASRASYDVIIADLFHPARSGAGGLYTVEHFAAVRERLAPNGLFCQWVAVHQMDLDSLRSIVAAFLQVYPQGMAVLASNSLDTPVLGLVARPDHPRMATAPVQLRLAGATPPQADRASARLEDEFAVLGSLLAGPHTLAVFAGAAVVNTDDRPVVTHRAPWATYQPLTTPRQRLLALLRELQPHPEELLVNADPKAARLQAYWDARRRYLEFGATVRPDPDVHAMLRQVQAPLLDVLRQSPDFRPAYEPLLAMAAGVAATDPARARALLTELNRIHPDRPDAVAALHTLP